MKYITVRDLSLAYPAFSESSIRWLIFNEHENGFEKCLRRIGRKVIINIDDFEEWIESNKKVT